MTARDPSSIFAPLPEIEAACIVGDGGEGRALGGGNDPESRG